MKAKSVFFCSLDNIMKIHGRESQLKTLLAAFGTDNSTDLPPSLFLWGLPSTGKTYVLDEAIRQASITRTARLSATEIMCGRRPFFETLLRQLQPDLVGEVLKSDNLRLFIRNLWQFLHALPQHGKERILIVLDDAEHLRKEHSDILDILVNLPEYIHSNICVIICSSLPITNFCFISNMRCLPSIHFPQYSKDDVVKIITTCHTSQQSDHSEEPEVYKFYVGMLVNVFYQACRDLRKLLRLTRSNWEYFYHNCSQQGQNNLHKLWKKIEPRLKADFKALNSQLLPMPEPDDSVNGQAPLNTTTNNSKTVRNYSDIPRYSRYLLVASYLATHNPPSSDKRFFVKASSGIRGKKRNHLGATAENENESKTGNLRSFELNRLKAIFGFIVRYCSSGTEIYEDNAELQAQLATLCQSRFIQSLGEDTSGNYKYRCMADYDFVAEIALSVNFELDKFLNRCL